MALTEPDPGNEDVVDLLIAQHQQVKNLFARLHTATGDAAEEPFHELRKMLAVHETAEEDRPPWGRPALRRFLRLDLHRARSVSPPAPVTPRTSAPRRR